MWAPFLVAGWLIIGILILIAMNRSGREQWLERAGQTAFEQSAGDVTV